MLFALKNKADYFGKLGCDLLMVLATEWKRLLLQCYENRGVLGAFQESLFSQETRFSFPVAAYFKGCRGSSFFRQPCHRLAARAFSRGAKRVLQRSDCRGAQRWGGRTWRMTVFRWPHPALLHCCQSPRPLGAVQMPSATSG